MYFEQPCHEPKILLRQIAVTDDKHTPLSAFLSACGLLIPFMLWHDTILSYLLILSPLYLTRSERELAVGIALAAIFSLDWPHMSYHELVIRLLLLVDAVHIYVSKKEPKYRIIPSKVSNVDFPIVF